MTSTFKICLEPGSDDLWNLAWMSGTCSDSENVCIVVLSGESRSLLGPGQSRTDSVYFIGADCHSYARTAHEQSLGNSSGSHLLGNLARIIRIIHGLF